MPLQLPVKADKLAPEEARRQFDMLLADNDPWAATLQREANAWRAHQEAQERIREEKAEALKEKRKQEEANRVQRPSAGRNRSPQEKAARARFVESKIQERSSALPPTRAVVHEDVASRNGGFTSPARPTVPLVTPPRRPHLNSDDPPYLDRETLALIRKITAAGYRASKDGKILYNNTEWLTPQEWLKRMPGIID